MSSSAKDVSDICNKSMVIRNRGTLNLSNLLAGLIILHERSCSHEYFPEYDDVFIQGNCAHLLEFLPALKSNMGSSKERKFCLFGKLNKRESLKYILFL